MRPIPALLLLAACGTPTATPPDGAQVDAAYASAIDGWHNERVSRLRKPDGWLSLVGLFWLQQGDNGVGTYGMHRVVLLSGHHTMGNIAVADGNATLSTAGESGLLVDGAPLRSVQMVAASEGRTVAHFGSQSFYLLERDERLGIRVKDSAAPTFAAFKGIERYPVDPSLRVEGQLEPAPEGTLLTYPDVTGQVRHDRTPGAVRFTVGGVEHRLWPLQSEPGDELFFVFADATRGTETYGGGRFLSAESPDADGRVVLDFNKSYTPPCAFTPYATCPLPNADNELAVAVRAGERFLGMEHE